MSNPRGHEALKRSQISDLEKLEAGIWRDIAATLGNTDSAENLRKRLPTFLGALSRDLHATRIGLDELISDKDFLGVVEKVIHGKFGIYRDAVEVGLRTQQGFESLFDRDDPSFLHKNYRPLRDSLLEYIALSYVLDANGKWFSTAKRFVNDISTLLRILYNLQEERLSFSKYMGDESVRYLGSEAKETKIRLRTIAKNINDNREFLSRVSSEERVVKTVIRWLENNCLLAYEANLMYLYAVVSLVSSMRKSGDTPNINFNYDLQDLEDARVLLGKTIRNSPKFGSYSPQLREFYLGKQKVTDLLKPQ